MYMGEKLAIIGNFGYARTNLERSSRLGSGGPYHTKKNFLSRTLCKRAESGYNSCILSHVCLHKGPYLIENGEQKKFKI